MRKTLTLIALAIGLAATAHAQRGRDSGRDKGSAICEMEEFVWYSDALTEGRKD